MHQFIGTWGVALSANLLASLPFDVIRSLDPGLLNFHTTRWLLTELPWFPIQVGTALWLGWAFSRQFHHRSMLWIWVIPLAGLCYVVIAVPTLTPDILPLALQAGVGQSRLSHYFGRGCRPEDRCIDQMFVTMPFYTSVFYSLGAFLAQRLSATRHLTADEQTPVASPPL